MAGAMKRKLSGDFALSAVKCFKEMAETELTRTGGQHMNPQCRIVNFGAPFAKLTAVKANSALT